MLYWLQMLLNRGFAIAGLLMMYGLTACGLNIFPTPTQMPTPTPYTAVFGKATIECGPPVVVTVTGVPLEHLWMFMVPMDTSTPEELGEKFAYSDRLVIEMQHPVNGLPYAVVGIPGQSAKEALQNYASSGARFASNGFILNCEAQP